MPNTESLFRDAISEALTKNDAKGLRFFAGHIKNVRPGRDLDTEARFFLVEFKDGRKCRVEVLAGWAEEGQVTVSVGRGAAR